MDRILIELLDSLDRIGQTHDEIYDTVCREKMSEPIFFLFIKPDSNYVMPDDFGLKSNDSNLAVRHAIQNYVEQARTIASNIGLDSFHKRLAAFQNCEIHSTIERNYYDDFFGWSDPERFDENGDLIAA